MTLILSRKQFKHTSRKFISKLLAKGVSIQVARS